MSGPVAKLPRPQLRGLLRGYITKNLIICGFSVVLVGAYMRFVYGDGAKAKYADYYKNLDVEKEFHRMRNKGLFDSCEPDPKS